MKKLKATDEIIVRNKNMNGMTLTYIKNEYGTYTTKEKLGLFNLEFHMSLDDIQRYIDWGLFELVKGEYEEDEELKEVKREDENKVSEIKNDITKNEEAEHENNKVIKNSEVVTGLDIIRDLRKNKNKSKYYNCKLKNLSHKHDSFERIIEDGILYTSANVEITLQKTLFNFLDEEFTLVKGEVTWQEAIDILTNQSDKYDVFATDNNGNEHIIQKHDFMELCKIVKNKWYVVEK